MMQKIWHALWIVTAVFGVTLRVSDSLARDAATQVAVSADTLHIESSKKMATFEGHVRFSVETVSIECGRMVVHYDGSGAILTAQIEGDVVINQEGATASAARAELSMKTGIVTLYGNPRFIRASNTLSGKRIRINIRTGEVDVFEAAGTFIFRQENNS